MLANARKLRGTYEQRKERNAPVDPLRPSTVPQGGKKRGASKASGAKAAGSRRAAGGGGGGAGGSSGGGGGAGGAGRGGQLDMHEVWEDLWTERPTTSFARAHRFSSAEPTGAKPSMRAYLQYLHVARAPGFREENVDLATLRATVSSPIFVARPTECPGPGSYSLKNTLRTNTIATFSRKFPRFPDPIPPEKRDNVRLKFPTAMEQDARAWLNVPNAKSIEPHTQRTDFTKLGGDGEGAPADFDKMVLGTKVGLATGARITPMKYSKAFRSKAPRIKADLAACTGERLGPGAYEVHRRNSKVPAMHFVGVTERARVNSSFIAVSRHDRDALDRSDKNVDVGPGKYEVRSTVGVRERGRPTATFLGPSRDVENARVTAAIMRI